VKELAEVYAETLVDEWMKLVLTVDHDKFIDNFFLKVKEGLKEELKDEDMEEEKE
jgi:hypothetical protein